MDPLTILMIPEVRGIAQNGVTSSVDDTRQVLEADCGHTVYLLTADHSGAVAEPRVWRVPSLPARNPQWRLTRLDQLHQFIAPIRRAGVDLIHLHHPSTLGWFGIGLGRLLNIPVVATAHTHYEEYAVHYATQLPGVLRRPTARWWIRTFFSQPDWLIAPTEPFAELLRERYRLTQPIRVIPTGIDPARYRIPASIDRVRALRFDLRPEAERVMYLGRMAPEKRVDTVIDACAILASQRPTTQFILVGGGPALEGLKRQVANLGLTHRFVFTGEVSRDEVGPLLNWAQLFLSACPNESQGITPIEAAEVGVPRVVVGALGLLAAGRHGVSLFHVPIEPWDQVPHAMAAYADHLLDTPDLAARFCEEGKRDAAEYHLQKTGQNMDQFYREVVRSHRGAP